MKLLKLHLNASRHHSGMIMIIEPCHVFKNEIYRRRLLPIFSWLLPFSKPYNRSESYNSTGTIIIVNNLKVCSLRLTWWNVGRTAEVHLLLRAKVTVAKTAHLKQIIKNDEIRFQSSHKCDLQIQTFLLNNSTLAKNNIVVKICLIVHTRK